MSNKDNFDKAIEDIYRVCVMLYGGYYEPKSNRDIELADKLHKILEEYDEGF